MAISNIQAQLLQMGVAPNAAARLADVAEARDAGVPNETISQFARADIQALLEDPTAREALGLARRALGQGDASDGGISAATLAPAGVRGLAPTQRLQVPGESTPKKDSFDASKAAHNAYEAMHGGIWGLGVDKDALLESIDQSPEELQQMRAYYKDHYGKSLDDDVKSELGGRTLERGEALLRGDRAEADAIAIQQDPAENIDKLYGKSEAHRAEVESAYNERATAESDPSLRDALDDELEGPSRVEAHALLDGNDNRAAAAAAKRALDDGDGSGLVDAVSRPGLDGDEVRAEYSRAFGGELEDQITAHEDIPPTTQIKAMARLSDNPAAFEAAGVGEALTGGDPEGAYRIIQNSEDRAALEETYEGLFGAPIKDHVGALEDGPLKDRGQRLLAGDIAGADAAKLERATLDGDADAIKEVYEGRSAADIREIEARWNSDYGRDPEDALTSEFSGRDEFEVLHARKGRPRSTKESLDRAKERLEYERGGLSGLVDMFTGKGEMAERNLARAEQYQTELTDHGRPTKAQHARLRELIGYVDQDTDSLVHAKDNLADVGGYAASAAASAVLVAATVASGGTLTPVTAPLLGAVGGASGSVAWHASVQGAALSKGEATGAAVWGAVGGAGVGWGAAGLTGRALGTHVSANAGLEAGLGAALA